MTIVKSVDSETIEALVKTDIKENQTVKTDGFRAYNIVAKTPHKHKGEVIREKRVDEVMKWTHILISNAKAFIRGTIHGTGKKHLQVYLDEFCYRVTCGNWEL
jgi:transposase-like protein